MSETASIPGPTQFIAYVRTSRTGTAEAAAQRAAINAEAARRGWVVSTVYEDEEGARGRLMRLPALSDAIDALDRGGAAGLVVATFDRVSRSVADAADLLERAHRGGWALVVCELGIDTSTPTGQATANVIATFAQLERRLIGQRTRDALAVRRAQGVRLGRPRTLPADVVARIVADRTAGLGWSAIGRALDAENVPTAQGGARWYPATVRAVYLSAENEENAA